MPQVILHGVGVESGPQTAPRIRPHQDAAFLDVAVELLGGGHLALIRRRRGHEPTAFEAEMNEVVVDRRGDCLPTPLYFSQQLAGRIDVTALFQPPLHAPNDSGVGVGSRPGQYPALDSHAQCRRNQGKSIHNAHDLRMGSIGYFHHFWVRPPCFTEPFEFGLNPSGRKLNEMAQPVVADTSVAFVRCRIEPSAGRRDLVLGDGLECAFRPNHGGDINQANQLSRLGFRKKFRQRQFASRKK